MARPKKVKVEGEQVETPKPVSTTPNPITPEKKSGFDPSIPENKQRGLR